MDGFVKGRFPTGLDVSSDPSRRIGQKMKDFFKKLFIFIKKLYQVFLHEFLCKKIKK